MSNKTDVEVSSSGGGSSSPGTEEFKEHNLKYNLSKFEYDLYHEEDDVAEKVLRIKRISLPNKGDRWKVLQDNKVMFVVEGAKLNNKEKDFLKTVEGFSWFLSQAKLGIKSFNAFKKDLKSKISELNKI